MKLLLLAFIASFSLSSAFLFQQPLAHPALAELSKAQQGTLLSIQLDVDSKEGSQLALQGLQLELLISPAKNGYPLMPGANGPNPKLSTGPLGLNVKEPARFVDLTGSQIVPLENGCWEMLWRSDAPAGALICGFHLTQTVSRNQASLNSGRIYMSFPIWTRENLVQKQAYKREVEARAAQHLQERDDKLKEMQATNNLLQKALLYRSAAEAVEKWSLTNIQQAKYIPEDDDVMPLKAGVLLTTEGTLWTKKDSNFRTRQILLGTATVTNKDNDN